LTFIYYTYKNKIQLNGTIRAKQLKETIKYRTIKKKRTYQL